MGLGTIHTVRSEDGWRDSLKGAAPLTGVCETGEEAVAAGRAQAQSFQTERGIRGEDGTIVERRSYGSNGTRLAG